MPLVLPALALFGLFGFFAVSEQRRRDGRAPGVIEGPLSPQALLPLPLPDGSVVWVTPSHPLWCRAVAYHMGLCLKALRLKGVLLPQADVDAFLSGNAVDLGDGGPSALARAAGAERAA